MKKRSLALFGAALILIVGCTAPTGTGNTPLVNENELWKTLAALHEEPFRSRRSPKHFRFQNGIGVHYESAAKARAYYIVPLLGAGDPYRWSANLEYLNGKGWFVVKLNSPGIGQFYRSCFEKVGA
mgnify:CR=1 FL=1